MEQVEQIEQLDSGKLHWKDHVCSIAVYLLYLLD
jgi:hypothetical protein